jgi:hypothetical protein
MILFVTVETGYCGSDNHMLIDVDDNTSDNQLEDICWDLAIDNASMYGFDLCGEGCEDEDCEYEHTDNTNISGHWQEYVPKEHDCMMNDREPLKFY